jgi:hypothetical protein
MCLNSSLTPNPTFGDILSMTSPWTRSKLEGDSCYKVFYACLHGTICTGDTEAVLFAKAFCRRSCHCAREDLGETERGSTSIELIYVVLGVAQDIYRRRVARMDLVPWSAVHAIE